MASTAPVEPAPLYDQTAFRTHLLAVIHDNPGSSGLEIKGVLDEVYGSTINHGRLYPNLNRLARQGLVEKGKKDDRTNTYELTATGREALALYIDWWTETAGDLLDGGRG